MLTYQPHQDYYHCMYRILSILKIIPEKSIDLTKLQILDFYFIFPTLATEISFPRGPQGSEIRKLAKKFTTPYQILPDKKRLFLELQDYQRKALNILIAKDIVSNETSAMISKSSNFHDVIRKNLVTDSRYATDDFFIKLVDFITNFELRGSDGLKRRTGLMEYRYDAI